MGKHSKEVSKLEAKKTGTHDEARKVLDDAWVRAKQVYKEAKEQADIVYKEAKKLAVDKQTKEAADKAYKEAVKEAEKLRDAITNEALAVFRGFWEQREKDSQEAITKSKESSDLAKKEFKEAKKQADIAHKEAKNQAVDKQAKDEADKAHKEARTQAKKDYNGTLTKE